MTDQSHQTNQADLPFKPEWIEAYILGQLDESEVAALDRALRDNPRLVEQFARSMEIMSLVRDMLQGQDEQAELHQAEPALQDFDALFAELLEVEQSAETILVPQIDQAPQKEKPAALSLPAMDEVKMVAGYVLTRPTVLSGIAAVLVLAITLAIVFSGNPTPQTPSNPNSPSLSLAPLPRSVATITAEHNAVWDTPAKRSFARGTALHLGDKLTLTQGFAEITTKRGAVAILEAPATIELLGDNALRLHDGKLVGLCHTASSKGFTVQTANARITDFGTEFGIHVANNEVVTTVFNGSVGVDTPDHQTRTLTTHNAVVVTEGDGEQFGIEQMPFDRIARSFTRRLPRAALVSSVELDGLDGHEAKILPQGFYPSAKLYMDREHQVVLNGEDDLPLVLIGADIVQMPAGLRNLPQAALENLQVQLKFEQPSDVYVLVPPFASPGKWLTDDYLPTDFTVYIESSTLQRRPCVVWKRTRSAHGLTTVAGGIETGHTKGMYTLVVTPASTTQNSDHQPIFTP